MSASLQSCWPHVFRFALSLTRDRHLAEDLAQDTMKRACSGLGQLRSPSALRTWLLRITANLWQDRLRKHSTVESVVDDELPATSQSPADRLSRQEDVAKALEVLQSLPQMQRAVLHLYAVEDLPIPEVADILKLKAATARVHLCLARRAVRSRLPNLWSELQEPHRELSDTHDHKK